MASTPIAKPTAGAAEGRRTTLFPFLNLKAQFVSIREEVIEAATRVLTNQQFILGPEVAAFEQEIADFVGCRFAIGCASGSDALMLALMALGIERDDEVITTPFTFVATAGAIARLGAKPVFVDIDPHTYNLNPANIERAITSKTRAILPVHLYGQMAEMQPIIECAKAHGIAVVEDAAQAIGAKYHGRHAGTIGAMGCFSFFPSKNLGGAGDGGMVTTDDPTLADRLKVLRVHGSRTKYEYESLGVNSRLDALQAAILRVKLRHLDKWASMRRRNALEYRELFREFGLKEICAPTETEGFFHVYNQFVIRTPKRDELREHLRQAGVPTEIYYPSPLHLQKAFTYLGHKEGDFPEAEAASKQVLALPIFAELSVEQLRQVATIISDFCHPQISKRSRECA